MEYKVLNIGRNGDQTQPLTDQTVSSRHAELSFSEGSTSSFKIRLLNMANNIWVNDTSVIATECKLTDDILLGGKKIKLDLRQAVNDLRRMNGLPPINEIKEKPKTSNPKSERPAICSKIITPANRLEVKSGGGHLSGGFSEMIPAEKPKVANQPKPLQKPELKKEAPHKKMANNLNPELKQVVLEKATREQIDTLNSLYADYKAFMRKENLQGFLVKMANGLPVVVLLAVKMTANGQISMGAMLIGFLILQALAIGLLQRQTQGSQKRRANFTARLRNDYRCPLTPDKPLFYVNSNLPIPFEELEEGKNCQLCGHQCKKNNL